MRRFLPLLTLVIVLPLCAQQSPQAASSPQSTEQQDNYGIPPAPKPGHPLDPNDVATLTGKNSQQQRPAYAAPQFYYTAPMGGSIFTQSSVGGAFQNRPSGYVGYGNYWSGGQRWQWGRYANMYGNGSQFADVSTETNLPFFMVRPGPAPIPLFGGFGTGRPGRNRWSPNVWFGPGSNFTHPTGLGFSPNPRP